MIFKNILLVGLGGATGSILRYVTSLLIADNYKGKFPLSTFIVNIIGSLIIGIVISYLQKNNIPENYWKYLLAVGFCGGFTTFSAFALENYSLLTNNFSSISMIYIFASIIACIAAVYAGILIVRMF